MSNSSLFVFPVSRAVEAANFKLEWVKQEREQQWDIAIKNAMKPFRRWFIFKVQRNREDAILYLKNDSNEYWCDTYYRIHNIWFLNTETIAKNVIKAQQEGVKDIYLSQEDAYLLGLV
jgi:hypothetical protein